MQKFTSTTANNWSENTTLSSLSKGNNKMPQIYENWQIISNNLYVITEKMPKISKDWQIKNFAEKYIKG